MKRKQKRHHCKLKQRATDIHPGIIDGHDSMIRSLRAEEDATELETTPLFRSQTNQSYWNVGSVLAIALLVIVFILGIGISAYLLYGIDSRRFYEHDKTASEHTTSIILIKREKWANLADLQLEPVDRTSPPLKQIIIVATGGPTCDDVVRCTQLLNKMQVKTGKAMMVNFLISSNGATFEALGWEAQSPMFPDLPGLVVAFIGKFTENSPSVSQVEEALNLCETSIARGYLTRDFTIVGKTTTNQTPTNLFYAFQNLKQWNAELSDEY